MSLVTTQPRTQVYQTTTGGPATAAQSPQGSTVSQLTTANLSEQGSVASSPSASAAVTDGQGHAARLALGNATAAGGQSAQQVRAGARSIYDHHGNKPCNLNTDQGRRSLISSSPQIDNNDKTTTDETRCGGAAMFNALVADGKPAKNATAIENTCKNLTGPDGKQFQMSPDQKQALVAMKNGTMTANQAAQMQELMVDMAKSMPPTETGVKAFDNNQITTGGMTMLSSRLKEQGAFSNSSSVSFTMQQNPDGLSGRHWTMSQQDNKGNTTSADSWPNDFGMANVASERLGPSRLLDNGNRNPNYGGEVIMDNLADGRTHYEMHQYYPQGNTGIHKTETSKYAIGDPSQMADITQN